MKSSTILKQVLDIFLHKYDSDMPGICDNLRYVLFKKQDKKYRLMFQQVIDYAYAYKPLQTSIYWWPADDVQTRIDVLNKAIADALANDD